MSAQSVSLSSMFGWIAETFRLLKQNFTTLLGASALTLVLGMLMVMPMYIYMFVKMGSLAAAGGAPGAMPMGGDLTVFYVMYAITIVVGLALFPPLLIGWFRLSQKIDQGGDGRVLDILGPYKESALWIRGIGFAALAFLIYVAVFGLFAFAFWGTISDFMQQVAAQQAAQMAGAAPTPPDFPATFFLAYFCFLGIALILQFVYMLGFAEVSLRSTGLIESLMLAFTGVLKNLLKLILFLFCLFFIFGIVFFIFALVLALVLVVLSMISPVLGMIGAIILYIPVLLCMYPLFFVGSYLVWKSVLGASVATPPMTANEALSA